MTDEERKARRRERQRRYNRAHYAKNQAAMIRRARVYYAANRHRPRAKRDPAKVSAYNKAYAAANKARLSAANKARWEAQRTGKLTMPARFCRTCQTTKPREEFQQSYKTQCRACLKAKAAPHQAQKRAYVRQWQRDHPDKVKAWVKNNRDRLAQWQRDWYARKPEMKERAHQRNKAYYRKNPHLYRASAARREAAQLKATPTWADRAAIADLYREACRLTRETGIPHEVDHIVPLRSRLVCGLHIHINMQVLTKSDNRQKSNRLMPHTALLQSPSAEAPH